MSSSLDSKAAIDRRQQQILGHPPRIPTPTDNEVIKASQRHVAKLMTTGGGEPGDPGGIEIKHIPEMIVALMGCHPELYENLAEVSVALMAKSSLPRRDLELVVLRTDWLCQSPYNWGEHVAIAKRFGVTAEEIERVTEGSMADGWSAHDRALLSAAEELHADAMISDDTWAVLSRSFNTKQLFELIVLVGQFTLVTYFQNSLRLQLPAGGQGLLGR